MKEVRCLNRSWIHDSLKHVATRVYGCTCACNVCTPTLNDAEIVGPLKNYRKIGNKNCNQ